MRQALFQINSTSLFATLRCKTRFDPWGRESDSSTKLLRSQSFTTIWRVLIRSFLSAFECGKSCRVLINTRGFVLDFHTQFLKTWGKHWCHTEVKEFRGCDWGIPITWKRRKCFRVELIRLSNKIDCMVITKRDKSKQKMFNSHYKHGTISNFMCHH